MTGVEEWQGNCAGGGRGEGYGEDGVYGRRGWGVMTGGRCAREGWWKGLVGVRKGSVGREGVCGCEGCEGVWRGGCVYNVARVCARDG